MLYLASSKEPSPWWDIPQPILPSGISVLSCFLVLKPFAIGVHFRILSLQQSKVSWHRSPSQTDVSKQIPSFFFVFTFSPTFLFWPVCRPVCLSQWGSWREWRRGHQDCLALACRRCRLRLVSKLLLCFCLRREGSKRKFLLKSWKTQRATECLLALRDWQI